MAFQQIPFYVGTLYVLLAFYLLYRKWRDYVPPIEKTSSEDLRINVPKSFDLKIAIPGNQTHHKVFQPNIYKRTCTCAEYKRDSRNHGKYSFRRICPHLREAFLESGLISNTPYEPLLLQRRESNRFVHLSDDVLLGYSKDRPWLDIYARKGSTENTFDRFGYDTVLKEWSAGYQPVDSRQLEKDILKRCA